MTSHNRLNFPAASHPSTLELSRSIIISPMQQYQSLKSLLHLPKFPSPRTSQLGKIDNADILLILTLILTLLNTVSIWHPLTVLLLGILAPLACTYVKIDVHGHYWMYVSVLLWLRLWHSTFSALDGMVFVYLWHPNLKGAEKLTDMLGVVFKKRKDSIIDRITNKVDRLLD